ncbi:leucine-rich repeat domain-containing protein [Paludisphaera rhizosphaerae]|uniref:hypothetical protein n=1 Tax=Paludisphaera rhizosphaerae TaxID=2711216 RepID=UPI0013EAB05D|nr:hypothetical protein [Paludisphaera rhizosphaerae]
MAEFDPPANVEASPSGDPAPPPTRPNHRLRALLALLAVGFAVSLFIQLDRSTVSLLGPWAENVYDVFNNHDLSAPSSAAKRFKEAVQAVGGKGYVQVLKPGFLGVFGREETYGAVMEGPACNDAALERLADSYGSLLLNLDLRNPNVSDAGFRHLERMTNLRHLTIHYYSLGRGRPAPQTKITDAGLAHLAKLPQLWTIWLSQAPITDAGLASIKDLPKLQSLYLMQTEVRGSGLAQLKSLPSLLLLNLNGGEVSDDGLNALAGATSLQFLSLDGVGLTPNQLPLLQAIPRLQELNIHGCGLLDEELDGLRKAKPSLKIKN